MLTRVLTGMSGSFAVMSFFSQKEVCIDVRNSICCGFACCITAKQARRQTRTFSRQSSRQNDKQAVRIFQKVNTQLD
jgi:hypothetical protein